MGLLLASDAGSEYVHVLRQVTGEVDTCMYYVK